MKETIEVLSKMASDKGLRLDSLRLCMTRTGHGFSLTRSQCLRGGCQYNISKDR